MTPGAPLREPSMSQPSLEPGGSSSSSQDELEDPQLYRHPAVRLLLRLSGWLVFPHGAESPSCRPSDYTSTASDDEEELDSQTKEKRMKDLAHDVVEEEKRFKFALLSTTILLVTLFNFLFLFFLCPGVEFTAAVAFSPTPSHERIPPAESDTAPTFRRVISTLAIINCTTFLLHHLLRSITFSACAVFFYLNGSVWLICILWGPVSELLGALVHVPVLAFYVFGHRSGAAALVTTLVQAVLYMVSCLVGFVPASGCTLKLGLTAQVTAIMSSYVLLGLCAALNERSRAQAVRMYQEAHTRLIKATKAKARFLANVSHELRTPLHGIVAASEELMERIATEFPDESQSAVREMCNIVTESSRHMLSLINDVLDLEQLDTNQLKIEYIPFDLHQEFMKLLKMLEPTARQKQISLTHRLDVVRGRRLGDPLRFRQIVVNLAANALKFTPEGGSVHITVTTGCSGEGGAVAVRSRRRRKKPQQKQRAAKSSAVGSSSGGKAAEEKSEGNSRDGDDKGERGEGHHDDNDETLVTVMVQDSGIGIPEDHIPLLFKSFTQADISTTRKFGGSGLGLAICKRLCQLMNGRIGCSSRRDQGSTFWFTLPLPIAPEEEKVPRPPRPLKNEITAKERELLSGLRVLLVEDHKINQLIGKQMLARAGCGDVVIAPNGEQAVLVWERDGPFNVVLMDYHMPVMDGLEATRRIRQREQEMGLSTRTPIIAISASLEPKDRALGASAGMDDWLEKPFDRSALTATILRWARPQP